MEFFIYILQVTLCLAFFYAFYLIALKEETTFRSNRLYLLGSLFISVIIPLVKIYFDRAPETSFVTGPTIVIGSYMTSIEEAMIISPSAQGPDWVKFFIGVYVTGIILFSVRFIGEIIKLITISKSGIKMNLDGGQCVLSEKVKTPFSFFNHIYLPVDHGFSDEEIKEVISHETAHIRGKHTLDVLFFELVGIVLWISPMIYLYRRTLRELHEFIADAAVLKDSNWEKYAEFLISQKKYGLQNQLSNQLIYSQLKKRIVMFTRKPSSPLGRMKYLGLIPLLFLVTVIFSFRQKELRTSGFQSTAQTGSKFNIYKDGLKIYTDIGNSWNYENKTMLNSSTDTIPTVHINALEMPNVEVGSKEETSNSREVFTYVEQMPTFVNVDHLADSEYLKMRSSSDALFKFINETIHYPDEARKNGIKGMVIIQFIVEADGALSNIKVIRGNSPELNEEALRVMNVMKDQSPKWNPGYHNGKPVAVSFTLPIKFDLDENGEAPKKNLPEDVVIIADEMPRFPGCEHLPVHERVRCANEAMFKFIFEAIKYPNEERKQGIEGTVIAQFIINQEGLLVEPKIVRGINPGLDEEVLRVIKKMQELSEKWIAGRKDDQAVPVMLTVPFKFALQSEDMGKIKSGDLPDLWGEIDIKDAQTPVENSWISIRPNPASDNIEIEILEKVETIRIVGISKVVAWQKENVDAQRKFSIDVSDWAPGKYVIYLYKNGVSKNAGFIVQQ